MKTAAVALAILLVLGATGCQATKAVGWFLAEGLMNGIGDDDNPDYMDRMGRKQREEKEAALARAEN
jgi:hypothetical protein